MDTPIWVQSNPTDSPSPSESMKANGTVCNIQIQQRRSAFGRRKLPLSRSSFEYNRSVGVGVSGLHFERSIRDTSVVGQSKALHLETLADLSGSIYSVLGSGPLIITVMGSASRSPLQFLLLSLPSSSSFSFCILQSVVSSTNALTVLRAFLILSSLLSRHRVSTKLNRLFSSPTFQAFFLGFCFIPLCSYVFQLLALSSSPVVKYRFF